VVRKGLDFSITDSPPLSVIQQTEAIPLTHINEKVVIQFLEQQLITRFGMPSVLVFDNVAYFSSTRLKKFSLDIGIIIRYSENYYLQGNGVAESNNKNLVQILKR
jgi:hypothetical protein